MAITSAGYPGTVDAIQWAALAEELGQGYGVKDKDDWKVTVVVGPDRTVAVAAGTGFGRGVMDVNSAPVNLQHATVASGVRYDTIMAHRNWSTPATTFTIVQGTSTAAVSASRAVGPGTVDDQPLALVQITAGSTVPVVVADLRTWPSKIITVNDLRALVDPRLGDEAVLSTTGVRYRRVLDSGSNPVWAPAGAIIATGTEGNSIGSAPTAGTALSVRVVSAVVTPSSAGGFNVSFTPFLNGVVAFQPSIGDMAGDPHSVQTVLGNCTLSNFHGRVQKHDGTPVTTLCRIGLTVVGW